MLIFEDDVARVIGDMSAFARAIDGDFWTKIIDFWIRFLRRLWACFPEDDFARISGFVYCWDITVDLCGWCMDYWLEFLRVTFLCTFLRFLRTIENGFVRTIFAWISVVLDFWGRFWTSENDFCIKYWLGFLSTILHG